jgi:hypothetical protein
MYNNISPSLGQGSIFTTNQSSIKNSGMGVSAGDNSGSIIEGLGLLEVNDALNASDQSLGDLMDTLQINQSELTSSEAVIYKQDLAQARSLHQSKAAAVLSNTRTLVSDATDDLTISNNLNDGISAEDNKQTNHTISYQENTTKGNNLNARLITLNAEEQDTNMSVKAYGFQYLVYILLLITIVSITFRAMSLSSESRIANFVILVIALLLLFIFAKWIYNKVYNKIF